MKISKNMIVIGSAVLLTTLMMTTQAFAAGSTMIVTGNTSLGENLPGWMFNRDVTTATPFEFNTAAHSIGLGSLYVKPIQNVYPVLGKAGNDKFIAENFINAPVSSVSGISYDFKIAGNGDAADKDMFYLNVYANIDNSTNYYDCRFDYAPTTGSVSSFTTALITTSSTPVEVKKRGSRIGACPATLAEMPSGSHIRMFAITLGDTSVNDTGLAGYFDNVVVNTDAGSTTYDFEPATTPTSKDACKKDGWMSFNTPSFKNQGSCVSFVQSKSAQK